MEASNFSDQELIEQSIAGNQKSLELLINRYRRKVFTYILLVVGDRQLAEDIFQDTFIKVINSLKEGKYQDNGRFLSWVTRIAHNLVIDYFRKEKQLSTVSDDDCDVSVFNSTRLAETNIEDSMVRDQIMEDVRSLIEQLPADQREVIMLRHYMGLSFKEIAEQTNVSINTALGRMRYALINLRKLIDEKHLLLTK